MNCELLKEIMGTLVKAPENFNRLVGSGVVAVTNQQKRLVLTFSNYLITTSPLVEITPIDERGIINFITKSGSIYSIMK